MMTWLLTNKHTALGKQFEVKYDTLDVLQKQYNDTPEGGTEKGLVCIRIAVANMKAFDLAPLQVCFSFR